MALGRGLSELLGEVETAYKTSTSQEEKNIKKEESSLEIDVELVDANPYQPRQIFDEEKLKELSDSIVKYGLLQPINVIKKDNRYTLIAGERRLRAHKLANIKKIKAIVLDENEVKLRELALIENIQRDDLNVMELAYSYAQLINEHNLTHDDLANRISKSRSSITNTLRLLQLSTYVQQAVGNDKISAGHAKVLLGLDDEKQKVLTDTIQGQKLSVRETEKLVKNLKNGNKTEEKEEKKNRDYNFNSLSSIVTNLQKNNLKAKIDNNYFKIQITSQEDIEKISKLFS